jgi:hypothetical protein
MAFRKTASKQAGLLPFDTREGADNRDFLRALREAVKTGKSILVTAEHMRRENNSLSEPHPEAAVSIARMFPDLPVVTVYNMDINRWAWPPQAPRLLRRAMPHLNEVPPPGLMEIGAPLDTAQFKREKDKTGLEAAIMGRLRQIQAVARNRARQTTQEGIPTGVQLQI